VGDLGGPRRGRLLAGEVGIHDLVAGQMGRQARLEDRGGGQGKNAPIAPYRRPPAITAPKATAGCSTIVRAVSLGLST
jgi:hypothetical protein